jgi:molybdopterin-binding protein
VNHIRASIALEIINQIRKGDVELVQQCKKSILMLVLGVICLFFIPASADAAESGLLRGTGVKQFGISMTDTTIPATPANAATYGVLTDGDPGWYYGGWYNKHVFDLGANQRYTVSSYQLSVGQAISNWLEFYDNAGTLITSIAADQHQFTKTNFAPVSGVRYVVLKTGNYIGELEVYGVSETTNGLEPITDLTAAPQSLNVNLSWSAVANATGYNIKRSTTSGGPYTVLASSVTESTYRDINLANGSTYYYVVTAVNNSGESGISNEAAATPYVPAPSAPLNLTATTSNSQAVLTWNHVADATGYTVSRATYSGGPYTTIASTVTTSTYTNVGLTNGVTYYYVVQAYNMMGYSGYSNEATAVLPPSQAVLDVVIAEGKVKVGQEFTANIVLRDTAGIYAEDFSIYFNDTLFEFNGFEEIPGYKVYHAINHSDGTLRFIVASQGAEYGINAETVFLKLKFRAKSVGFGIVDATKGRIADTTAEFDLNPANCLEDYVIVENQDVNMSGEYTLLDLAIDAAHYGQLSSTLDPTKYAANQVGDDTIRDEDLVFIVNKMLSNRNYTPNYR